MKMRTLIVDDERLARQKLRTLLQRHSDVELVGECADGDAALAAVARLHPDLVFLDVRMPGRGGFEVVKGLGPGPAPHVVFVTAYGDYAVEAFEVEAIDYLLKPFDRDRLDRAMARVRTRIGEPGKALARLGDLVMRLEGALAAAGAHRAGGPANGATAAAAGTATAGGTAGAAAAPPLLPALDRVAVKKDGRTLLVPTQEIDWIEAVDKYVRLHARGARYLHREALSALERRLDPAQFLRIHRGAIVNLRRVREIHPGVGDEPTVVLADGTRLPLSRRYRARLRARGLPV
jgi:two-component system LytT family response regulator